MNIEEEETPPVPYVGGVVLAFLVFAVMILFVGGATWAIMHFFGKS